MSAARRKRKRDCGPVSALRWTVLAIGGLLVSVFLQPGALAATTEWVVANRHTGLAISGFDPVAYFVDGGPREGWAEIELSHSGVIWRFRNAGNRDAFLRHPDIYRPCYGGYDPTSVAEGFSAAGHPAIWLVRHERLYLFRSDAARRAFQRNPDRVIRDADRRWPGIMRRPSP